MGVSAVKGGASLAPCPVLLTAHTYTACPSQVAVGRGVEVRRNFQLNTHPTHPLPGLEELWGHSCLSGTLFLPTPRLTTATGASLGSFRGTFFTASEHHMPSPQPRAWPCISSAQCCMTSFV